MQKVIVVEQGNLRHLFSVLTEVWEMNVESLFTNCHES